MDKVARAVEDRFDMTFCEIATLDDVIDSFVDIRAVEFEGARDEEAAVGDKRDTGEIDQFVIFIDGKSFGIGIYCGINIREHQAPML